MTYATLREKAKKGRLDPAYFLHGDNQFLIDELVETITSAIIAPGFLSIDRSVLYGDEISSEAMLNAVETPPMASSKRVVVLNGVHRLSEKMRRVVFAYLEDPAPTTVFITTAPKAERKKKSFYKQLALRTTEIRLNNLKEKETVDWIRGRVAMLGRSIDSKGARMLYNSIGNDQSYLANEIDKLILCTGEKREITENDVAAVAGKSRANSIFDLTDAVGSLDCYRSVSLVNNLIAWGHRPTAVVAFILRHMLILLGLKSLQRRGASRQEMCRRFNLLPYFLGGYLRQSAMFTETELRERIRLIQVSEGRLKSLGSTKAHELESLMFRMCRGGIDKDA